MLTKTSPALLTHSIDGADLRAKLTQAYEDSTGDVSDLRRKAVAILKREWDMARDSLLSHVEDHRGGLSTARALSKQADEIVHALWDFTLTHVYRARNPTEGERLSLVAVGGYGRGELAPHSDLDLLFLRAWKETPHSESVIEFILYSLWDLGLKVGHASRTVDETIRIAREDHTVMTALLEYRPLAGDTVLVQSLKEKLNLDVIRHGAYDFVTAKLEERDFRHAKSGASRYVVEPNLKEGKGGLRDLHTLFWIAKYVSASGPAPVLRESARPQNPNGWGALDALLTEKERLAFVQAFDFLWKVRILLHVTAGRAEERLSFDLQPEIARLMGYIDADGEPAVERFMRRYFLVAKEVGALTRIFCTKLEAQKTKPLTRLSHMIQSGIMSLTKPEHPGIVIDSGRLSVQNADVFKKSPIAMFILFRMADKMELDLHPDAFTAITRNLKLINAALRRDKTVAEVFLDILVRGKNPYRTLSLMTETGLLGRYIPEFGQIVAQTQFNMYHTYTVDEHTLRAVGLIREIELGKHPEEHPLATSLIPNLANKETLYLAMLLHDTGKGGELGQEIEGEIAARRACARLGLEDWQIDQVAWLVRHHLVLSDYAQKRDVSDPETVAAFARIVETPERLRQLLILTVADIRAVGPGVWNGWKGQLMRELLAATESAFRGGRGSEGDAVTQVREDLHARAEALREQLGGSNRDMRAWLATMEESYLFSFSPDEIRQHAQQAWSTFDSEPSARAHIDQARNAATFCISGSDRPGLFADLARCFTNLGANVVGAQVFTSTTKQALDIFYVQDSQGKPFGYDDPSRLRQLEQSLEKAALGEVAPPPPHKSTLAGRAAAFAIAPTVVFDDESNAHMTIIEVSGRDRPGLLADVASVINKARLDIASAHIDCYGERAVDAFYVVDHFTRQQLSKGQKDKIRRALSDVLDPPAPRPKSAPTRAKASLAR
ncbi:[protein-PII] uridylyltransferase [Asticcacaulis sp. BYS171W]|uniref:Bifunctional uridylyltransferase/uridylyl-removing enzyme n=1 Tax=Asticcacaulis aquaticus TaxID=2984212 RepID=A0ABT5HST6_9CAUL|nr:[protein-PII] uridylyltransferase [Asticcacaulis aquaticus]MDC7683002.1 [protein-PII] uridylyltransferase [Asticcacaulis aquaticus]